MYNYPAMLLCDFYKFGHRVQYPDGMEEVYSTWTPRDSRITGVDRVVSFGLQAFVKKYLIDYFNEVFFNRPEGVVVAEYERFIKYTLGVKTPDSKHIRNLHQLGYLPLRIRAIKEGTLVPLRVPMITLENTNEEFFWVTNYLETLLSCESWGPSTSATIAFQYLKKLTYWANKTDEDASFVQWQGHDFSFRGMMGVEAAILSGMGHLTCFTGTDTSPAILALERFYNANIETELIGGSVPATEHSVMSAGGKENEFYTYKRLVTEVCPAGIISIVSDTWDLWNVVGNIIPALKNEIMSRDGKVVIRPDSGDPVKILCGDLSAKNEFAQKGLIECLWNIFGGTVTSKGYKKLDSHIGAIYGDSITTERAEQICTKLAEKGFASTNVVFGIGSYTYQYNTRDTFGFAVKATDIVVSGREIPIFKDPVTDTGMKKSQKGRVAVLLSGESNISYIDELTIEQQNEIENDILEDVFLNGKLIRDQKLSEIRGILRSYL